MRSNWTTLNEARKESVSSNGSLLYNYNAFPLSVAHDPIYIQEMSDKLTADPTERAIIRIIIIKKSGKRVKYSSAVKVK